jgi:hypothetical protein
MVSLQFDVYLVCSMLGFIFMGVNLLCSYINWMSYQMAIPANPSKGTDVMTTAFPL